MVGYVSIGAPEKTIDTSFSFDICHINKAKKLFLKRCGSFKQK